jgi:hypothetical protein
MYLDCRPLICDEMRTIYVRLLPESGHWG